MSNGIAANAIKDLKATNATTRAVKNQLEQEMKKQEEATRQLSKDYNRLTEQNAKVREDFEKVKKELTKIKSEGNKTPEKDNGPWKNHHSAPGKKIRNFICMEEVECSCDKIGMENSRNKMNNAIKGLKEAIRCPIDSCCHKINGKKIFLIIKYAAGLPGISDELLEIWHSLRETKNVLTRRDLVKISCILNRYADEAEDGLLYEYDRNMYSAGLDFMEMRDETIDDYSTDNESIETLNSTSRAYGAATGARPKAGNQKSKSKEKRKESGVRELN